MFVQTQGRFYDIIRLRPIPYQYKSNFAILKLKQFCDLTRKLCLKCYRVYLNILIYECEWNPILIQTSVIFQHFMFERTLSKKGLNDGQKLTETGSPNKEYRQYSCVDCV